MNAFTLILRGLLHFRRTHAGVVLGSAVGTAVLVGALVTGDSVRATLREQALHRIGGVESVVASHDRLFVDDLGERLAAEVPGAVFAPVLQLTGVAARADASFRANDVYVVGVDAGFFALAPEPTDVTPPAAGEALLNARLAQRLNAQIGDTIVLRVEQPSELPRDMVLATTDDAVLALRLLVKGVLAEADFGRFGLAASQIPPANLFVPLDWLQEQLGIGARANLLLTSTDPATGDAALRRVWTLADAEIEERLLPEEDRFELRSRRVFLDDAVAVAADRLGLPLEPLLTYFVNTLAVGERETPYSTVTAVDRRDMRDDEVVVNEWLAEDLGAAPGDTLRLDYFVPGPKRELIEASRAFRIREVLPLAGRAADPTLMPDFPGLAKSEHCRDWEPGVEIDLERIREKDETYWDEHRGTPKAFVTLAAGRDMWASRFGSLTAIRAPASAADELRAGLRTGLDPASFGLAFLEVRGPALSAAAPATDFGMLFLGLSFFLIVSALLLTALLFGFGVEQRAAEIGTLLAVGFRPVRVRAILLGEALVLAVAGAALGTVAGLGYTLLVLRGLGTLWADAVGETTLALHASPLSLFGGAFASVMMAGGAIALVLRQELRREAHELLAGPAGFAPVSGAPRTRVLVAVSVVGIAGGLAIVLTTDAGTASAAGAFFGAGALLLVAALALSRLVLARGARAADPVATSVAALGVRNSARRAGRSLATVALLACGTFLVVAVGANRLGPVNDPDDPASGTGGYRLFARATLPVLGELDEDLDYLALRVRDGDDASCLNLSRVQQPRLVGVDPEPLAARGAFTFARSIELPGDAASPWELLASRQGDGAVPAIGDQASVQWQLHKAVGDTLAYRDELGRDFDVRIVATLAGSILQGELLIHDEEFERRFPSESGHRMFLIDAPAGREQAIAAELGRAFADNGLEVEPAAERLAAFNAVQNTYILIFQMLGGLGLLLGSAGLGMVVLRNTLERRGELALLRAVGFRRRAVHWLVLSENAWLLVLGVACGALPAVVAVLPAVRGAGGGLQLVATASIVLAVTVVGALWAWLATAAAARGPLVEALRND